MKHVKQVFTYTLRDASIANAIVDLIIASPQPIPTEIFIQNSILRQTSCPTMLRVSTIFSISEKRNLGDTTIISVSLFDQILTRLWFS